MQDPPIDWEAIAEENFARFPPELRERIRHDGDRIGQRVCSHVVQILIGVPGGLAPPEEANHGSGVVALVGARPHLFTAQHVLQKYRSRKASAPSVVFQAGNVSFDPAPRILFESVSDDIVVIALNVSEQLRIPANTWIPDSWPPAAPTPGEFVAFAGLPAEFRVNQQTGEVDLAIIGGLMRVASSTGRSFRCIMERERLIKTRGPGMPPPGVRLGGMSGGPVFRILDGGDLELTGIITDFGPTFEIFMMAPLSIADLTP